MLTVSCDQAHVRQARVQPIPDIMVKDRETGLFYKKSHGHDERADQLQAIQIAFSRRTDPKRAQYLAELCYRKTLGTVFTPLDLAEIALTETGGFHLSNSAVSHKGAVGVWQLMPSRAKSHGYTARDMRDDDKCAEAAVLELQTKLRMARGDKIRAKKLYCGVGREANAYEVKRRRFRLEILDAIDVPVKEAYTAAHLQDAS
jgi:hypothetical protein